MKSFCLGFWHVFRGITPQLRKQWPIVDQSVARSAEKRTKQTHMHSLGSRWPSLKRDRGIISPAKRVYRYDQKTVVQVFPKLKELAEDPRLDPEIAVYPGSYLWL